MGPLKLQSNGPLYRNTVVGTLAVDGWAVTFGTARRGLGAQSPSCGSVIASGLYSVKHAPVYSCGHAPKCCPCARFLPRDCSLARLYSAAVAVVRCLAGCLSVRHVRVSCRNGRRYGHSCYGMRIGNRSHTSFRMVPFQMTVNDQ